MLYIIIHLKLIISFKMPKLTPPTVETTVKVLSEENNSYRVIKEKLKKKGTEISLSTISNIINEIGISRQAASRGEKKPKYRRPPVKRTPGVIRKVQGYLNKKNPKSYRFIKSQTGVSIATISKIIHQDLKHLEQEKNAPNKAKQTRKTNT